MLIKDYLGPIKYSPITEAEGYVGPLRCEGVIGRYDEKNANGRIYTKRLWERLLSSPSLRESLRERGMVGEIDHPDKSELKLRESAVVWTDLSLTEGGEIRGVFEVLPTTAGKELEALIRARVRTGASTRGEGSIVNKDGADYISEDDYNLHTIDIVANPSTRGAFPQVVQESTSNEKESGMPVKEKFDQLKEQARRIIDLGEREVSESSRATIESSIDILVESLDRVVTEDAGYQTLATSLSSDLLEAKKAMKKATSVESKLEAATKIIEGVTACYRKLKTETKSAVALMAKDNDRLKKENAQLRRSYAVAIQEGEAVLGEKRVTLEKYALALEAGEQILQKARKLSESREAAEPTRRPARQAITEGRLPQRAQIAPKRVVASQQVVETAPKNSATNQIAEAAAFASSLLRSTRSTDGRSAING